MLNTAGICQLLAVSAPANAPEVLVFSEYQTPRLVYTCRFIFETALQLKFRITANTELFNSFRGLKVNYSSLPMPDAISIIPNGLCFEGVFDPGFDRYQNGLTHTIDEDDLFSAVFFLISRYEEWQLYTADQHNRFETEASILVKQQNHTIPVIEVWLKQLQERLAKQLPDLILPKREFKVVSTIDVDNLFAYRHKPLKRIIGGTLRDLSRLDFTGVFERFAVLTGTKKDPFDVYEEASEFCFEQKIPLIYFFLQKTSTNYDRTINPESPVFSDVIKQVKSNFASVGIHPSYYSDADNAMLQQEIDCLSQHAKTPIEFSRQHFLRFDIRKTPVNLIKAGVKVDFTMGFAKQYGFRAGTSLPFYYYNFELERQEDLLFVPFCAMDGVWTEYKKDSAQKAQTDLIQLAKNIKSLNGIFLTVYHERSFSDHLYKGFGSLYKNIHTAITQLP